MKADEAALPVEVRKLLEQFRNRLRRTLGPRLIGLYLLGSIAFPGFMPQAGDIDFYAVLKSALTSRERAELNRLHRILAQQFEHGARLDGFYIPLPQATSQRRPRGLTGAAGGRIHRGARDTDWALHRMHLRRGACRILHGSHPQEIFAEPSAHAVAEELRRQEHELHKLVRKYPAFTVLSFCRLIFTWKTGRVVVSKIRAAEWGLTSLPGRWHRLIQAAMRTYRGRGGEADRRVLRSKAAPFMGYAITRMHKLRKLGSNSRT